MAEQVVLAIDTSTVVAVGLAVDGDVVGTAIVTDRMAHAEQLIPLVRRVFAGAGVTPRHTTSVVVGLGPGPFTGLRVGIVTARTLAYAWSIEPYGVCSLDVLAAQHLRSAPAPPTAQRDFVVATDARRQEVYWARYDAAGRRLDGPSVGAPESLPALPVVGPGALAYADRLAPAGRPTPPSAVSSREPSPDPDSDSVAGPLTLDPGTMAVLGATLPPMGSEPLYLRRPDAAEPGRRKRVTSVRVPSARAPR